VAIDLGALERKYRVLSELRARREAGEGQPTARERLRALAREFPGCLRELDTLGAPELQRRARAAEAAARGGAREAWMDWIRAYHEVMRAALHIRASVSPKAALAPEDQRRLAEDASAVAGVPLDESFVDAVRTPPYGRIGVVVLRALAARFGQPAETIARALFPVRRPSPYDL
jgi:hypothetical protein